MRFSIDRRDFLKIIAAAGTLPHLGGICFASDDASQTQISEHLDYYYDLFTRIAYDAPTEPMREMIVASIAIYDHKQPWFEQKNFPALLRQCSDLSKRLENDYRTIRLEVSNDGLKPIEKIKPVDLTYSMARPILVELHNKTADKKSFTVNCGNSNILPMNYSSLEPNGSKLFLVSIYAPQDAAFDSVALSVSDSSGKIYAPQIQVPVKIEKPAKIRGIVIDADNGNPFPAKVSVLGCDNLLRYPAGNFDNTTISEKPMIRHLPIGKYYKLPFFYSDGSFELEVPAGSVKLTIERGYEYEVAATHLDAKPGQSYELKLKSGRFIDMKSKGWYSGDTHIHWAKNWWSEDEELSLLALVQRAEDIRVANNLTLYQYRPEEQGGSFIKPAQKPAGSVKEYCDENYHIQMAEEYRNDNYYGHLNFLNIKSIVEPIATGRGSGGPEGSFNYPLNKTAIEECRRQGGISIEAHNLGPMHCSDVPVNVIMGYTDSLDQLMPENYYRFLDCGIQLPLTNGSDHPARPAGECRAYVKIDGAFSYQKWIDGIKARRTFTTSGPLIFLTVNGSDIGERIDVSKGEKLHIVAKAVSRHPIGKLQVLSNTGEVLKEVATDGKEAQITFDIDADRSRWFIARCSANDNYYVLDNYDAAHTSAIYVNVDGKPVCYPEAVNFWIELLKRHSNDIATTAKYEKEEHRQQQLEYVDQALTRYRNLL